MKTLDQLIQDARQATVDAERACIRAKEAWQLVTKNVGDDFLAQGALQRIQHANMAHRCLTGKPAPEHD